MRAFLLAGAFSAFSITSAVSMAASPMFITLFRVGYTMMTVPHAQERTNMCRGYARDAEQELFLKANDQDSGWWILPTEAHLSRTRTLGSESGGHGTWCTGGFTIPIVSTEPVPRGVGQSYRIRESKVVIRSAEDILAEYEFDPLMDWMAEIQVTSNRHGDKVVALSPRLRSELSEKLLTSGPLPAGQELTMELQFSTAGPPLRAALRTWSPADRAHFERTLFLNPLKYLTPSYYRSRCAVFLSRWR